MLLHVIGISEILLNCALTNDINMCDWICMPHCLLGAFVLGTVKYTISQPFQDRTDKEALSHMKEAV